jgi:hypothetical protein
MPEQWSDIESEHPAAGSVGNGSWSADGVETEVAEESEGSTTVTAVEAEATEPEAEAIAEEAEEAASTPASEDIQPTASDADSMATDDGATAEDGAAEEDSTFLTDLARAMQATAGAERARIDQDTERRRQAAIDEIRAVQSSEADRMRELADEELASIDAWADGEIARIQQERERRAAELNADLEVSLAEHGTQIDRRIERVEAAVATYRAEVDAFFADLDSETDVVRIAQQATQQPDFPALDAIGDASLDADDSGASPNGDTEAATDEAPAESAEAGRAARAEEPAAVGVMDPNATSAADALGGWPAPADLPPQPEPVSDADPVTSAVAAGPTPDEGGGSIFQSVPVLRPMSWLRRDPNGGDRPNRE